MRLSCKEATRLVSEGLDRRLGFAERIALRLHLLLCDGCSRFKSQLLLLRRVLARLADR
jgi:Putative zinc-finger